MGDEGGFAPNLPGNEVALEVIVTAIEKAGYAPGRDVYLALDCAASEFYRDGQYVLAGEQRSFDAKGFADYLANLVKRYPVLSIEDGMDESDWEGWSVLTARLGDKVQLVGDDLFVTNPVLLKQGHQEGCGEFNTDQTESDRHLDGNTGNHRHCPGSRLQHGDIASVW